jgi:FkbM family methyltransferase
MSAKDYDEIVQFYGQFRNKVDEVIYKRYFKNKKDKGVCLECGSHDGVKFSSTKVFEESLGWKSINIEAHPESYKKLEENRPDSININCALSNKEGELSFRHGPNHILRAHVVPDGTKESGDFKVIKVPARTYKDVIGELGIEHLDLFVLDVEGHEMDVLRGMEGTTVWPDVFVIELNGRKRQLREFLKPLGYIFDGKVNVNGYFIKEGVKNGLI